MDPNGFGSYDMNGNAWEMCWDWHWKNWYFETDASGTDPKGPDLSNPDVLAKVNYDNWLVRTVRGGSGNTDKSRMRISYRKDFNKTWFQYAITVRPVVAAPSDPFVSINISTSPSHLGSAYGGGVYEVGANAQLVAVPLVDRANFLRWEDADGNTLGTSATLSFLCNADTSISAVFEDTSNPDEQLFSLQVLTEPFGSGSVLGGGAYMPGSEVVLTAIPAGANNFAGWSGDASGVSTTFTVTMDGHKKVLAYFGDTSKDTDEDGLSDLYEQSLGTDPENTDSDFDGISDGDEMNIHASNPLKMDTDDDGFTDLEEVKAGTPLNDGTDFPFLPKKDLQLWYLFKGKAFDMSDNRYHGKINGATPDKDRHNFGKNAYRFKGSKSTIEASGFKGVGGSAARTVSVWLRADGTSAAGGILHWGTSGSEFGISVEGGVAKIIANASTISGTTDIVSDELWHQVVVSIPDGGSLDDASVYIDGKVEITTGSSSATLNSATNSTLTIGVDADGNHFKGYIDDVWTWSRPLAASEVDKLYEDERPKAPPEPDVLRQ